jgi:hypothetical protein
MVNVAENFGLPDGSTGSDDVGLTEAHEPPLAVKLV